MSRPTKPKQLFLLGQQLCGLTGVVDPEERRFHVCGGVSAKKPSLARGRGEPCPWTDIDRDSVRTRATGPKPWKRVALVCDAGLGKSTNLEWLCAAIAREQGSRQIPLLL